MGDGISDGLKDFPGTSEEDRERNEISQMCASINLFAAKCGDNSRNHGFWQAFEDADWLEEIAERGDVGRDSETEIVITPDDVDRLRVIAKHHRLMEVATKLLLVVSECGEAFESLRDTGFEGHLNGEGNFGEELADVGIRLGDLAEMSDTKLGDKITIKMAVNKNRPHKHGRQA